MMNLSLRKDTKGSFTIEGAISVPIMIIFMFLIIRMLLILDVNNKFERILYEASKHIQENEIIIDIGKSYLSEKTEAIITKEKFKEYIDTRLKESKIHDKVSNVSFEKLDVFPGGLDIIDYTVIYQMYDIKIKKDKFFKVPRLGKSAFDISDVWKLSPLNRGRVIIKRFGGNLAHNYPLISRFVDNEAAVIKSINPDSISYMKQNAVYERIKPYIIELDKFNELINNRNILSKKLLLVVPINTNNPYLDQDIERLREECLINSIEFEKIPYGKLTK